MPVHYEKDTKGCYAQWGDQAKYYYECGNDDAKNRAGNEAEKQGRAIRAAGYMSNAARAMYEVGKTLAKNNKSDYYDQLQLSDISWDDVFDLYNQLNEQHFEGDIAWLTAYRRVRKAKK